MLKDTERECYRKKRENAKGYREGMLKDKKREC